TLPPSLEQSHQPHSTSSFLGGKPPSEGRDKRGVVLRLILPQRGGRRKGSGRQRHDGPQGSDIPNQIIYESNRSPCAPFGRNDPSISYKPRKSEKTTRISFFLAKGPGRELLSRNRANPSPGNQVHLRSKQEVPMPPPLSQQRPALSNVQRPPRAE